MANTIAVEVSRQQQFRRGDRVVAPLRPDKHYYILKIERTEGYKYDDILIADRYTGEVYGWVTENHLKKEAY